MTLSSQRKPFIGLFNASVGAAALLAAWGGFAPAQAQEQAAAPEGAFALTILHTNDFHSRVEPINRFDSTCSAEEAGKNECFGGSARLASALRERRSALEAAGTPYLLLDAGDQMQGSLFYTHYRGAVEAEFVKAFGYQAMAVGNHEFDGGTGELGDFVRALDGVPLLSANAVVDYDAALRGSIPGATVLEAGGQKIGVVGLTPEDTTELASTGDVKFLDAVATARGAVEALKAAGIDKIILLSHSGYARDKQIAAMVSDIDLIVGGHSHSYLSSAAPAEGAQKPEGPYPTWIEGPNGVATPIVQAYAYGKYLGEIAVTFDDKGVVTAAAGEPLLLDHKIPEDNEIAARVAELAKPLEEIRSRVVAQAAAPIDGSRDACRVGECAMGVLVADAMLARGAAQGVQIAIQNGGGLRASIDGGEITMGEVLTVLPFQNTLATMQLKGSEIVASLESGVSRVEEGAGRFPQVAGLRYTWTRDRPANEGRIIKAEVSDGAGGWKPIDPSASYIVATNNFMRNGGDGYALFASNAVNPYDYGPNMEDVVVEYLTSLDGPYAPHLDGRISEVK